MTRRRARTRTLVQSGEGTQHALSTIDNLLRCGICCEFLNIAMILPKCSHNYCSQCIRRYMNYKSQCPACNTATIEGELRNNKVVDEIVKNFVAVRPAILKLCKGSGQRSGASTSTETPPRRRKDDKNLAKSAERASSMTPGTSLAVQEAAKYFTSETPKRPPSAEPTTSNTPLNRSNEENISPPPIGRMVGGDDGGDDDDVIVIEEVRPLPAAQSLTSPGTSKKADSKVTRSDKSDCPVCGVAIAIKYINSHLDGCLKRSTEQPRKPAKQMKIERRKPLPKLVYNIMSDKELRKKLKEYKLATQGTRKELIRRIQEYTVLFNAQCDSDDPVPVEDVIKYHERMEKIRTKPLEKKSSKTFRLKVEKGQDGETIAKSQQEYSKHHNRQFEDLIRAARLRMEKAKLPNMDGVIGADSGSSATSAAGAAAEGTCSKSKAETAASSVDRIVTRPRRAVQSIQPGEEPEPDAGCDRLSTDTVETLQHESNTGMDQTDKLTAAIPQAVGGECVTADTSKTMNIRSMETALCQGNTIPSHKSGIIGNDRDTSPVDSPVDAEVTDGASSVEEEPQSPTLFDNFSFSDEDFQTEGKDVCLEGGQATEGTEPADEQIGDRRMVVEQVNSCQSPAEGGPMDGGSVGPSTGPSDLQTSPVFNGGIRTERTPLVESISHNSAPPSVSLDFEGNQDGGERLSTRGRLRRKRKTVLEQLDVDMTSMSDGETTRRASKRNKKSLN